MKKQNIPSSLGQIIGRNKVGIPILKPTRSDIARNLAKSRSLREEAEGYDAGGSGRVND